MTEWQPIDTAPKGEWMLCAIHAKNDDEDSQGWWMDILRLTDDGNMLESADCHVWVHENFVKWMPLPEPPK